MRERSVLVLGDGRHEVGDVGQATASDVKPALPSLIHRLLGEPRHVAYRGRRLKDVFHARGRGLQKKIKAAMRTARNDGADALAVVVDRDGRENRNRLTELKAGRDALPARLGVPCAVGMAVEEFDAWMITDRSAMAQVTNDGNPQAHDDPESLRPRQAKAHAHKELGSGLADKYATIAAQLDLDLLKRTCSGGFRPFAQEVTDRIAPVVETP